MQLVKNSFLILCIIFLAPLALSCSIRKTKWNAADGSGQRTTYCIKTPTYIWVIRKGKGVTAIYSGHTATSQDLNAVVPSFVPLVARQRFDELAQKYKEQKENNS